MSTAHRIPFDHGKVAPIVNSVDADTIRLEGRSLVHVQLVSAAAETRTLGNPEKENQYLLLSLLTDGGDVVVTSSSAFNVAGDTTLTFDDAGDSALFVSVETAAGTYRWQLIAADGVAGITESESANLTFSGHIDFSGTRIDPESVQPTTAKTLTASGDGGKTFIAGSLCRKFTLPLAAAANDGVEFTFVNGRAATGNSISLELWIDPVSADKVNGGTSGIGLYLTASLDTLGDHVTLKSDGSGWWTISRHSNTANAWLAATGA